MLAAGGVWWKEMKTDYFGLWLGVMMVTLCARSALSADPVAKASDVVLLERGGKRDARVHDPSSIVKCAGEYWLFATGVGVRSWRSTDLVDWEPGPRVFPEIPGWVTNVVARQRGHFWAPDVIHHDGHYLLYYSVSRFGVNTSAIGLVSTPTLDPADPAYRWTDRGVVIQSGVADDFNAIDPAVIRTAEGELWMSFGSFWSGIKLVQLDPGSGLRVAEDSPVHSLASYKAIEAPHIFQHDGYYYLFLNWDRCCRGLRSTYNVRVGRSRLVTGPYLDRDGVDMLEGGGTLLLETDGPFIGPGHPSVFEEEGEFWFSCHFYDGTTRRGTSMLAIRPLRWGEGGWPVVEEDSTANEVRRFDFGTERTELGYTLVSPLMRYSVERGYGFEPGSKVEMLDHGGDPVFGDGVSGEDPFFFSVALPQGDYRVTVTLGGAATESATTIKAESRRLMLEDVRSAGGESVTRSFAVNVRTPEIASGGRVRLKDRERSYLHWDDKLTLEFNGTRPSVASLEIRPAPKAVTVYLAGDSTVTDQPREPWNSWGQMLTRFFDARVSVANHAESGESIRSSLGARRFDKIFSSIKPGDYLFFQFGHNDMKEKAADALATYRANLERLIDRTREKGATPVLVTSMERKSGVKRDTLREYPSTVREVAASKGVALIDLHAMSKVLYGALGSDLDKAFQDGTHHNNYGSYELAKCVVEGIRRSGLRLVRYLREEVEPFDPARPDPVAEFALPATPLWDGRKPDGD